MTDPLPDPPELHEYQTLDAFVEGGYDWLAMACNVISALSLMLITITLIVRL